MNLAVAVVSPGARLAVAVTVRNQGELAAPQSIMRFYLSRNAMRTAGDRLLTTTLVVPTLPPGQTITRSASLPVPLLFLPAMYFVIACADDLGQVVESNKTNNCTASSTAVTVLGPDLVMDEVTPQAGSVRPGRGLRIVSAVQNQGLARATTSTTRFYLSVNGTKNASARLLTGSRVVPPLAAGAGTRGTTTAIVPRTVSPGTYFVLACADDLNRVMESDKTNNCRASSGTIQLQ